MLKDYRESFVDDLRDPEFQREYLAAAYEEEGADGVIRALREIANAGTARTSLHRSLTKAGDPSLKALQTALQTLGLDFAIVRAAPHKDAHAESVAKRKRPGRSPRPLFL